MANILIIDNDESIIESFKSLYSKIHNVLSAKNYNESIKIIQKSDIDIIFLDYRLGNENGLEILKKIKKIEPEITIIFITAYGSVETIINAISLGAYDYLEKPLDIEKIDIVTKRVLEIKKIKSYVKLYKNEQLENFNLKRIIGKSNKMQNVLKTIGQLINNEFTVLITGESGVGKELIAKALHYNSIKKNEPFIAVNCSGLNETLLDNELFGHEEQAFTGAKTKKIGRFEAAGEGTIFLDEIGDMPLSIQSKLLRVLQEKEFNRLGGQKLKKLKARVICATNKNLEQEIKNNNFRHDLFYRINVARIEIPSLRERKTDIPLLLDYFVKKSILKLRKKIKGFSNDALKLLNEYNWPGNVRELENTVINICINLKDNIIDIKDLPKHIFKTDTNSDVFDIFLENFLEKYKDKNNLYPLLIKNLEKKLIQKVSNKFNLNKTELAKKLGISRITLYKKI